MRMGTMRHTVWIGALALSGCGGAENPDESGAGAGSGLTGITATATEGGSSSASESDSDSQSGGSMTSGPSPTSGNDSGSGGEDDGPKFDLPNPDGGSACGGGKGGGGGGSGTFSYIWIANSSESTVSKINTQTMVEEGRYITRADSIGSPSRTSVNLNGNMAVANRSGGITAFWANPEDCDPMTNGVPGLQTSSGGGDILPWGQDDCLRWSTPINASSNRPAAWAPGQWSDSECRYVNNKFWTAARGGDDPGTRVMLLDGETGVIEQTIPIPEFTSITYGGAVDGDGNFWGHQSGGSQLFFVDRETFQHQIYAGPGDSYGIAVDDNGFPWTCYLGVHRLNPATGVWDHNNTINSSYGGCMSDGNGTMWLSHDPLLGIDINTMQLVQSIDIPQDIHGVSIDFDGYVWGVPIAGSVAYRIDPVAQTVDQFDGLVGAYTYSDMTGFALANAGSPSG
ncbi:MAG: hypothetical protein ACE37F_19560 [Nannocystaceae bacterium]|nr:hypothetical protein [bacterium]